VPDRFGSALAFDATRCIRKPSKPRDLMAITENCRAAIAPAARSLEQA